MIKITIHDKTSFAIGLVISFLVILTALIEVAMIVTMLSLNLPFTIIMVSVTIMASVTAILSILCCINVRESIILCKSAQESKYRVRYENEDMRAEAKKYEIYQN